MNRARLAELLRLHAGHAAEQARIELAIAEELEASAEAPTPPSVPRARARAREPYRPPPKDVSAFARAAAKRAVGRIVPK